jgi:RNA polymerase sigma-70 factor, ECF subfamily
MDGARRPAAGCAGERVTGAVSDQGLLAAARCGDEQAFVRLTGPHRQALHVHCYRILGSLHDADDALQETMLRAWRGIDRFEPRAPLVAWLYRIATNVCRRMLEQRGRQVSPDSHLEPYPERLLDELRSSEPGPEAVIEERESVGLAFVTAMQLLPPRQRIAVILRDVLGWSADEVAALLGDSVASVNSALQRGRERLERERREGAITRIHAPRDLRTEARLMERFQDAWAAVDIPGLVALLADDALLTMPPEAARIAGRSAIGGFFGTVPLDGDLTRIRLLPARANGQPALAAYAREEPGGPFAAYGVMVFAIQDDRIAGIVGFPDVDRPELFERLGLPVEL